MDLRDAGLLVVVGEVRDAGGLGVHVRAAEAVLGDLLAGDRLDHVRAVMNICEVSRTMNTKSVSAGL
ncbi:hypothetical protein STANM309S_04376 [Streptomyces tanashiensis]